jgi:hypothetical protein
MINRAGEELAVRALQILANAEPAPITANQIKAVEQLLSSPEYAGQVDPETLARAIADLGIGPAAREAQLFAAEHRVPLWRGLVATWFKETRKRRRMPAPKVNSALKLDAPSVGDLSPVAAAVASRGIALNESSSEFASAKRDNRPARQGWASGPFLRRCVSCEEKYVGALSSTACTDCACGTIAAA